MIPSVYRILDSRGDGPLDRVMMELSWSVEMGRLVYCEWHQFQTDFLEYMKWKSKLNTIMVTIVVLMKI